MATKKTQARKYELAEQLEQLFDEYKSILVVEADNVGSNQLHEIRKSMRGKCVIYCGKNTQMRRVIRKLEENGRPELENLRKAMKLNVALVFTNGNVGTIRDEIMANKLPAAAKAGSIAQCSLVIPAGMTALEPTMTNFLQALNISSKITKGLIEVISDHPLFEEGEKVDASQAALLQKMEIFPFAYGLIVIQVFADGTLFSPEVLDITDEQILNTFRSGMQNIACVSIETSMPTIVSVPYSILIAFSQLLAIADQTSFSFKQGDAFWAAAAAAPAAGTGGGGSAAPAAAAAKKKTTTEEDDMPAAGGLFDEGDDY